MTNGGDLLRYAEEKEVLADRFDGYVENLMTILDHMKTGPVGAGQIWSGPAAQRFDRERDRRYADVGRLIEQCRRTAWNLRKTAEQLRRQARQPGMPL